MHVDNEPHVSNVGQPPSNEIRTGQRMQAVGAALVPLALYVVVLRVMGRVIDRLIAIDPSLVDLGYTINLLLWVVAGLGGYLWWCRTYSTPLPGWFKKENGLKVLKGVGLLLVVTSALSILGPDLPKDQQKTLLHWSLPLAFLGFTGVISLFQGMTKDKAKEKKKGSGELFATLFVGSILLLIFALVGVCVANGYQSIVSVKVIKEDAARRWDSMAGAQTSASGIKVVEEKAIDLAPGQRSEPTFVSGSWRVGPDTVKNEQVLVEHLLVRRNGTVSFYATNTVAFNSVSDYSAGTEVAIRFTNKMTNAPLRVVVKSNKSVGL